jgi:hypothetical protein
VRDEKFIHIARPSDNIPDNIKAVEMEIFFYKHPQLSELDPIIKSLLPIFTLMNKNEIGAYKILIQRFPEKNTLSYGEAKDTYEEKVYNILKDFR